MAFAVGWAFSAWYRYSEAADECWPDHPWLVRKTEWQLPKEVQRGAP